MSRFFVLSVLFVSLMGVTAPSLAWGLGNPKPSTLESISPSLTALATGRWLREINFNKVTDLVYRGASPLLDGHPNAGLEALVQAGVKTIIDLQGGDLKAAYSWSDSLAYLLLFFEPGETKQAIQLEQRLSEKDGMRFISAPLDSFDPVDRREALRIDRILDYMHDPDFQPIYVHCQHGKDRTGLVVALYRVRFQNWDIEKAHQEMVKMGHSGFFNHMFTGHLDEFYYRQAPIYQQEANAGR